MCPIIIIFAFLFFLFNNNNWLLFKFTYCFHTINGMKYFFSASSNLPVFNILYFDSRQTKKGKSWDFWLADLWLQFISQIYSVSNYSNHLGQITSKILSHLPSTPVPQILCVHQINGLIREGEFILPASKANVHFTIEVNIIQRLTVIDGWIKMFKRQKQKNPI